MPNFDVQFEPLSSASTDLDDQGFVGAADTVGFNVTTDTPGLDAAEVRQLLQDSGQIPREGVTHPASRLSVVRSVQLRKVGPVYFKGTISYRSARRPRDQTNENQLPWEQPAKFAFRSVTTLLEIDEDTDGEAIVNPGTKEPVTGITRPATDLGITITKNLLFIDAAAIAEFANKVNNDEFLGLPPGVCKTGDIAADPQSYVFNDPGPPETNTDVIYYTLTVPVVVREVYGGRDPEKAWWHRRRLQGFYELKEIDGEDRVVRALDDEGQPVTTPVLLDIEGRRLAADADPVFIETQRFETVAFNSFGIL